MLRIYICCFWLAGLTAFGQNNFTNATPGADYATPGNWSGGAVPTGSTRAHLGWNAFADATHNTAASFTTSGRFVIGLGSGTGSLTLGAGSGTLTFGGNDFGGANYVGVDGGTGTLTLDGGSVVTTGGAYLRIGSNAANANGTVNVNDGLLSVNSQIHVGNGNASNVGNLNISGGTVRMNQLHVGSKHRVNPGGTGNLAISGSGILETQGNNPRIFVGNAAGSSNTSTFSLADNGQVISGHDFIVGLWSKATGTQTGGSIDVAAAGDYFVGALSEATMTQTGGIVPIAAGANEGLAIGVRNGGNGTFNFEGGEIELADLKVGGASDGTTGVGTFNFGGGILRMNGALNTPAAINLSGTGGAATIDTNGNNATFSGLLSGTGGLIKDGGGTLTLSNTANSFTGGVTIKGGTVPLTFGGPSPATNQLGAVNVSRTVRVENGGTLELLQNDVWGNAGTSTPVRLEIGPGGLVTNLNKYNTLIDLTIDGGTLESNGGANTNYPAYQLRGTVTVPATGAGSRIIEGAAGNVRDEISLGHGGAVGGGRAVTFDIANGADLTIQNTLKNAGNGGASTLQKTGQGALVLEGNNTYTGPTNINAGTLQLGDGGTTGSISNASNVINNGTLVVDRSNQYTYTGLISGSGGLVKEGAGNLTLTNAGSTFSGDVDINDGSVTLSTGHNNTNPTSALGAPNVETRNVNVNAGTELRLAANDVFGNAGATPTFNLNVNGGTVTNTGSFFNTLGDVNLNGGNLVAIGGANGSFRSYRLFGDVTVGGTAASTITTSGNNSAIHLHSSTTFDVGDVTSGADLIVNGGFRNQTGRQGSAAGALLKTGAGTMVLNGTNVYTGPTTIAEGTLQLGDGGTTGSISNASNVVNNGTLVVDRSNDYTYAGLISGSGGLVKEGAGTFEPANANNSFSGDVDINEGTVLVTSSLGGVNPATSALGATNVARTVTVGNGGVLDLRTNDVWGNHVSDPAARLVIGAGGLVTNLDKYNVFRDLRFDGGTLEANGGAFPQAPSYQLRGTVSVTGAGSQITVGTAGNTNTAIQLHAVNGETTFDVDSGADLTIHNVVDNGLGGVSSLRKTGAGVLNLLGANTYGGPTNIDAGTLLLNGDHQGNGNFTIASGATLGGNGSAASSAVTVVGTLSPGNSPDILGPFASFDFTGSSSYDWELLDSNGSAGPTGWDRLDVSGLFEIDNTATFSIAVDGTAIYAPGNESLTNGLVIRKLLETGPFDIVSYGSIDLNGGSVGDIDIDPGPFANLGYFTLTDTGSLLQLTFTATVPEPSTYALMALLLLAAIAYRQRQRQRAAGPSSCRA